VCRRCFGCVVAACDGAVHYRYGTSPLRRLWAASPPLVAATCAAARLRRHRLWRRRLLPRGCHRCDSSRLRCHRLWPRRVLPVLGVTACAAARRHRLWRRRSCRRRLRRRRSLPLRDVAAATCLSCVATACGGDVCGRSVASPSLVVAPSTTARVSPL
jgi:hypothetical protein